MSPKLLLPVRINAIKDQTLYGSVFIIYLNSLTSSIADSF